MRRPTSIPTAPLARAGARRLRTETASVQLPDEPTRFAKLVRVGIALLAFAAILKTCTLGHLI